MLTQQRVEDQLGHPCCHSHLLNADTTISTSAQHLLDMRWNQTGTGRMRCTCETRCKRGTRDQYEGGVNYSVRPLMVLEDCFALKLHMFCTVVTTPVHTASSICGPSILGGLAHDALACTWSTDACKSGERTTQCGHQLQADQGSVGGVNSMEVTGEH